MTVQFLLKRRILAHATKQWGIWRLLLDWTVVLYGVIPFAIFLGYHYMLLWQGEIEWVGQIPAIIWAGGFLLVFLQDNFFVWVDRADLIVLSDRSLIKTLKHYSLVYHFAKLIMKYSVVILAFLPVLVLMGWSASAALSFGLSVFLLAWLQMWLLYQLKARHTKRWMRLGIVLMTFICLYALLSELPFLAVVLGSSLIALALYVGEGWLSFQPRLSREVELAESVRSAFDRTLLSTSGAIEKPSRRKRPLYRPSPDRFGSVQRTLAVLLYIRTPRHRNLWLRLIPLATIGMIAVPSWFKLLIPLYIGFVAIQERNAFKQEMERHPFFRSLKERTHS